MVPVTFIVEPEFSKGVGKQTLASRKNFGIDLATVSGRLLTRRAATYAVRVIVAHFNRTSRQAVMELTQQHIFPHVVNIFLRVFVQALFAEAVLNCSQSRKIFDIP
jgi:hypothetical protein